MYGSQVKEIKAQLSGTSLQIIKCMGEKMSEYELTDIEKKALDKWIMLNTDFRQ